ncbi:hypothetical protein FOA52_006389 [Chlamydomonas sp. UWO 241]|nr:hypothetical protein FOA52_006389 [Chlamydomonas sp. UWO 241]
MLSRLERQQLADPHEPAQQARRGGSGSGGRRRWSPSPPGARQQQLAEAYGEEPSAGSSGRGSSSYPAAAGRGTGARGADGRPDAHGSSPPPPLPVALRKFPTPAHLGRCLLREAERCLSGEAPPVTLPAPPPPPPRADVVYQTDSVSKRIKAKRARAAARAASGPARTPHKRAASSSLRLRELSSVLASAVRLGLPLGRQSVIRFMTAAFHGMWPVAAEAAEQTAVEEAAEAAAAAAAEQPAGVGQQAAEDMQRAEHFAHSAQKQAAARAGGGGRSGGGGSGGSSSDVTAQALTELIWAVSWLGMSRLRTDWGARYLQCVRARSHAYSPQGTAVTLQALARLQCMPPLDTRTRLLTVLVRDAEAGRCCPPDVSMTLWALARLKCGPPPGLGTRLLSATQAQLPRFTAQEMANTIWGCAKLRLAPPAPWVRTLLDTAPRVMLHGEREGGGGGGRATQALSTTLYAMAVLQLRPEEAWLSACVKWTAQHIHEFTPQGLACIVYACALMGYCPSKAWLSSFHRVASAAPDADVHPATHTMLANAYAILGFVPPDPLHGDGPPPSWAESLCEPHAQQQQQQRRVVYHDDRALGTSPLSPALGQASGDYDGAGADTVGSRSGGGWHLDQRGGGSARRQHSSVTRPSAPPLRATLP